jgi:uncharacterized protein (DUF2141 family)
MRRRALFVCLAVFVAAPALARHHGAIVSSPELGQAEGRCRPGEAGPALLIDVAGLKDRQGLIKAEVYPSVEGEFLADDNALVEQGKTFRRVEQDLPAAGQVTLCIRVPAPGAYSVVVLHDRDRSHKYGWFTDGVGFAGNPRLGWHKPSAAATRIVAGPGLTRTTIVMNYKHRLGVAPIRDRN